MPRRTDVVIIGGGLAGASLAVALEPLNLSIDVLESIPFYHAEQPSFDERTMALTWSSRKVLQAIGIWHDLDSSACPIHSIHVSNQGHSGMTRLDRSLIQTEALGYVVPSRHLGAALLNRIQDSDRITYHAPASALAVEPKTNSIVIKVNEKPDDIDASLAVLADGGRSPLGQQIGVTHRKNDYPGLALITTVVTDRDHQHRAYERFTRDGPLALLPSGPKQFALAWTLPKATAGSYAQLPDGDFLAHLQNTFGDRAGFFERVGERKTYALSLTELDPSVSERLVAIGNAAHIVHPVAGQGFNLGLRDVAELAETLLHAVDQGKDIGALAVLSGYADRRRAQTRRVLRFTDSLVRVFSNEYPGLTLVRNTGLRIIEMMPSVKRELLRRTTGLSGHLPQLARGLPLTLS